MKVNSVVRKLQSTVWKNLWSYVRSHTLLRKIADLGMAGSDKDISETEEVGDATIGSETKDTTLAETTKDISNQTEKSEQLVNAPKRKVALLLAFCGKNYYGLQLNRGDTTLPTIEGALFQALVKAKVVPEICLEKSQQMKYASSSRTDKGVSTCGLVVSLKLRMHDDTVQLINEHLPLDIRVLDLKRVTKSFHAKNNASGRTYSYTMPTFPFEAHVDHKQLYRISEDKLKHVSSVLYRYKGTHTFHNFTSGKRMGETSAKRYIIDFWAETPFVHESLEFLTLKVKGQSFMIHQIRKMVGLLITLVSGRSSEDHFIRAFSEPLEDIPKAPGNGLILEQVHYEGYNKKHGHLHGGIDWSTSADKAQDFMRSQILPILYKEEIENSSMEKWLEGMANHDFTGVKAKEQWMVQMNEWQEKATKGTNVKNGSEKPKSKLPTRAEENNKAGDDTLVNTENGQRAEVTPPNLETKLQSNSEVREEDGLPCKRLKLEGR